jgi:hypothetical protein
VSDGLSLFVLGLAPQSPSYGADANPEFWRPEQNSNQPNTLPQRRAPQPKQVVAVSVFPIDRLFFSSLL